MKENEKFPLKLQLQRVESFPSGKQWRLHKTALAFASESFFSEKRGENFEIQSLNAIRNERLEKEHARLIKSCFNSGKSVLSAGWKYDFMCL